MASLKIKLYLGICLCAWIISTAENSYMPQAENIRWLSLDFKTILIWTTKASDDTYNVLYSWNDGDWSICLECIHLSETACDLTNCLFSADRTFTADIQIKTATMNDDYDPEDLHHTYSPYFNPYRQSNISAVKFTVEPVDESTVTVNITDPLTSIHLHGKQLNIRDVFKNDLKYKISYYKSGSTGKRDVIANSSKTEVSKLEPGQSYCFMVAAYIPSRPKATQQGAWSKQWCTQEPKNIFQELSLGAWVGAVFILITVLIIVIVVTVLCCNCCQQRNQTLQTTQSSAPV